MHWMYFPEADIGELREQCLSGSPMIPGTRFAQLSPNDLTLKNRSGISSTKLLGDRLGFAEVARFEVFESPASCGPSIKWEGT
jgi:hypothetical protein